MEKKDILLTDAEWKVMDVIWGFECRVTAKDVSLAMAESEGWNKNTTYTVLKRLVAKGAIVRNEPNFLCIPVINKDKARFTEAKSLLGRLYEGSLKMMFSSFAENEEISEAEAKEIMDIINRK